MTSALRLDNHAIKQMRRRPELAGKKPIARGMFSAIFDGSKPSTVYKMTIDSVGYWLLNCTTRVKGKHFPKVISNPGCIGDIMMGDESLPVYLYELERLEKTKKGGDARVAADRIEAAAVMNAWWASAVHDRLACVIAHADISRSLKGAIRELDQFVSNYPTALLDMHQANFMQRKNGELVITDPLCDETLMDVYRASVRRNRFSC